MSQNTALRQMNLPQEETATDTDGQALLDPQLLNMKYLVRALVKYNASDLHIKVGRPPLYRINGRLIPAKMPKLTQEQVEKIIIETLNKRHKVELEEKRQTGFSISVGNYGRFRCSVFFQRETLAAVVRMIPFNIPSLDRLGVPAVIKDLCLRPRGLLLITGSTGRGKSTTLAGLVQHINENRHAHILMIEDPIEFIFRDRRSSITQREVGSDTQTFQDAIYSGLRQDPDIIVIGEMRDPDVIRTALTAAETGHLVISTLHTNDAKSSLERILDVFPSDAQNQVRLELASTLVGVVAQTLLMRSDGNGRVLASEVLVKSPAIESLILKNQLQQIPEAISNSSNYYQMQTLNQDLERLIRSGMVRVEEALKVSSNPDDLKLRIDGIHHDEGYDIQQEAELPEETEFSKADE